jgi:hypothetical protein
MMSSHSTSAMMKMTPNYDISILDESVNNLSLSKKDVKKINDLYSDIVNKNRFMQK